MPRYLLLGVIVLFAAGACTEPVVYDDELDLASSKGRAPIEEPITPIVPMANLDVRRVELGKRLFFDRRLSRDHNVACVTCHDLDRGGASGRARSIGALGAEVNTPTVFNAGLFFRKSHVSRRSFSCCHSRKRRTVPG